MLIGCVFLNLHNLPRACSLVGPIDAYELRRLFSFPTAVLKHSVGIGFAVFLSIFVTLFIQRIIKIEIDF